VADDFDFDGDALMAMPYAQRTEMCLELAARAKAMADASPLHRQERYLLIAHKWLNLAEEMEQTIAESSNAP